jgi:hypothetical protein
MSGKSKARREAKAADRATRSNQRAQADLQRRWHLTLAQSRQVDSTYSRAVAELLAAGALMDEQPVPTEDRALYEPHCVMEWREQMAGMDDMGGVDTALARGDGT